MGPLDLLNHLFNFFAPALVVGVVLALAAPFLYKKKLVARVLLRHVAINFVASAVVCVAGLWFFGRDAKMASYGAMLVAASLAQALAMRKA